MAKCNNEYCYWNGFGECCPESEDLLDNATPNQLDCPSSLRKDLEEQLYKLLDECHALIEMRGFVQLNEIRNFILSQESKKL